jgi:WD40 repeat protein
VSYAGDHEARVMQCVFSSHSKREAASWSGVQVWDAAVHPILSKLSQLYCIVTVYTPTFIGHYLTTRTVNTDHCIRARGVTSVA